MTGTSIVGTVHDTGTYIQSVGGRTQSAAMRWVVFSRAEARNC